MILYYHTCVDLSQQLQSNRVTTTAAILYGSLDGTSHAPLIPHFPRIHTPNSRTRHTYYYYQILYTVYGTHLHIPAINIYLVVSPPNAKCNFVSGLHPDRIAEGKVQWKPAEHPVNTNYFFGEI